MSKGASPSSLQIGWLVAGSRAGLPAPPFALGSSLIVCSNPPPNAGFEGRGVVAEPASGKTLHDEGSATFAAASGPAAGAGQGLDHHEGQGIGMLVAEAQVDVRLMPRRGQPGQVVGGVTGQGQGR